MGRSNLVRLFTSASPSSLFSVPKPAGSETATAKQYASIRLLVSCSSIEPPREETSSSSSSLERQQQETPSHSRGAEENKDNQRDDEDGDGGDDRVNKQTGEIGGPRGPEPTRYGDWERNGRCYDF